MSYEAAVAWSIIRSLLAGALCLALARRTGPLARPDGPMSPSYRLLLIPFFMPGLVVGYAYRNASLSLVQTPLLNELLYLAILMAQLTPVVVLALEWLPAAAMGPAGAFLLKQTQQSGRKVPISVRLRAILAGELPRQLTAAALVALLCFQEVEVATLMQARGWAEWIFTKQAGGVELTEVLPFLILPVGYGLLLTVPVLAFWTWDRLPACQSRGFHHGGTEARRGVSGTALAAGSSVADKLAEPAASAVPLTGLLGSIWVAVSWLLVIIWPVVSLAIGAIRGAGVIRFRSALWQEIGDALVLAVTVTLGVWMVLWGGIQLYNNRPQPSGLRRTMLSAVRSAAVLLVLPGLLGSLALGLTIFEICQRLGVQPSYSPVPLVVGMVLFLLPRGMALQAMLRRNEQQAGVFLAESLAQLPGVRGRQGAAILWRIRDAGRFWTLALLFWWSYLELTLPALLRPAGMAPAPLRLYNFLHYGHIPGLAAMLVVVLLVPVVLLVVPVVLLAVGRGLWSLRDR